MSKEKNVQTKVQKKCSTNLKIVNIVLIYCQQEHTSHVVSTSTGVETQ